MNKLFHRLSTCILLGILLAAAISAVVYTAANGALKAFFQYYAMQPEVFQRLSDEHFADLQDFATENHIVSTDGKPFTQWNDKYHYVSLMVIRQNEGLCYNSFVSYNMTYTEEDSQTFFWGSKVLPTYEYQLQLEDETCKVYFSGYFDQAYTSLRKAICGVLFVASFVTAFFLLFQKYIRYIGEMEQNVSSLCNKNFSQQIPIRYKTELSTLAANINHLGDTIQLLLLTEDAKLKQKEQFVKSIAHDIRTPLTVVIGYLELLSKGYAGSQESAQLFIDRALEKTNHIRRLTDDLHLRGELPHPAAGYLRRAGAAAAGDLQHHQLPDQQPLPAGVHQLRLPALPDAGQCHSADAPDRQHLLQHRQARRPGKARGSHRLCRRGISGAGGAQRHSPQDRKDRRSRQRLRAGHLRGRHGCHGRQHLPPDSGQSLLRDPSFPHPAPAGGVSDETKKDLSVMRRRGPFC